MTVEHLFYGSAIGSVSADGRVKLPPFVRSAMESGSRGRALLFGPHERDRCLTGCDVAHVPALHADIERRRVRDEETGAPPEDHFARLRRAFGFAEETLIDGKGRMILPAMMRRRGRIEDLALFVGTGSSFEVWNPDVARETGSDDIRELAEFRLDQRNRKQEEMI
jgi:MraZ protein